MVIKLNGGIGKSYADEYKPLPGQIWPLTGVYATGGGIRPWSVFGAYSGANTGTSSDGDYAVARVYATGFETVLYIGTRKASVFGVFDLYINDVLDSSGYDLYASTSVDSVLIITLTIPLARGWNQIKIKMNGKNAASSNYGFGCYGVRLQ